MMDDERREGLRVLSLFDGISCGMMALERAGIPVGEYHAWEIDKYAVRCSEHNYLMVEHHGDVFDADFTAFGEVDAVIGGSPCTYWSIAQTKNRETEAHGIGWELFQQYVRAVREAKPRFFIYENNRSMADAIKREISEAFGFGPHLINSALVSAQNRQRYYWVGIRQEDGTYRQCPVEQPVDRGILLRDVLDEGWTIDREKSHTVCASMGRTTHREYFQRSQGQMCVIPVRKGASVLNVNPSGRGMNGEVMHTDCKSRCLTTNKGEGPKVIVPHAEKGPAYTVKDGMIHIRDREFPIELPDGEYVIRKLSVDECKRLQTIPESFDMKVISSSQAYKCIGNGWTVDVIAHLLESVMKDTGCDDEDERMDVCGKVRLVELFAGIGAQVQAMRNLGLDVDATVCEIDEAAYRSYCAIHGDTPNLGDITKVEHLPECDVMTWSFPCQAISNAGAKRGMAEGSGTESALAWEVIRLLRDARERGTLPRYLLMENVKALLYPKNVGEFEKIRRELEELGYTNSWKVLNALDFGVAQNRERVFMVSSLDGTVFDFPEGERTDRVLRDYLEDDPAEENFLTEKQTAKYERIVRDGVEAGNGYRTLMDYPQIEVVGSMGWKGYESMNRVYGTEGVAPTVPTGVSRTHIPKIEVVGTTDPEGFEHRNRVHSPDGYCPTVTTNANCVPRIVVDGTECIAYPTDTKLGYMPAKSGDGLVMDRVDRARGTVQDGRSPTLTTGNGCGVGAVTDDLRIRFITPREAWRLMGFTDDAYDRAVDAGASRSQLYRQAGNSIVVPVLEGIFRGMLIDMTFSRPSRGVTLDDWL